MPDPESTPIPSRRISWPLWLAVGLMALGVATSVVLALVQVESAVAVADPLQEEAKARPNQREFEAIFLRLQGEVSAAQTPEQQIPAALNIVDYLLKTEKWRTENERQRMAREYLLALAELPLPGALRFQVAHQLLALASVLQDTELLASGETLLRGAQIVDEPMPFDLLCAEVDALLELGDPITVYLRIDELGTRSDSPDEFRPHLLRVVRGLRRALEDEGAMRALCLYRKAKGTIPDRAAVMTELDEAALVLARCGQTPLEAEGLWHQAYLARLRGAPQQEIDRLKQVLERGLSPVRALAYMRLADRLREDKRDLEYAALLGRMIEQPELQRYTMGELQQRLRFPATNEVAQELLRAVDLILIKGTELAQPLAQLLLAAGRMAVEHGWLTLAEGYLAHAEPLTLDRAVLADSMALKAEIAQAQGKRDEMVQAYQEVINLYPDHPQEADIRFLLIQEKAAQPFSEADLVGGIIGAITRLPKDPRGIRGLLVVAKRLDDLKLYELAETYYRLAVLLSTMQQSRDVGGSTAEALLGQARAMAAQGKLVEAESLLRVINTNVRWSDIWSLSGPLWAALAFQQGQFQEGVRRWRYTCGPLGGELLPYLFGLLAPNMGEWPAPVAGTTPRKPGRMPPELVEAAVAAAMEQFLGRNDYAAVEHLLTLIENDPEWNGKLSLDRYRIRVLQGLVATESYDRTADWLNRHPVQFSAADVPAVGLATGAPSATVATAMPEKTELAKWLETVEAIRSRVRALPQ